MDLNSSGRVGLGTLMLVLASGIAGCSTLRGGDRPPSPHLRLVVLTPQASTIWLTAAATGTIEPIGECVYFVGAGGVRRLALWPDTFELERQAGVPVGVRSTRTGARVAFGDTHTFGGGGMSALPASLAEPLPAGCSGPAMMLYFD